MKNTSSRIILIWILVFSCLSPVWAKKKKGGSSVGGAANSETIFRYLGGNDIAYIDLDKLNDAKNISANNGNNKTTFAIMDILREWQSVKAHREKRSTVKNMITRALKQASDGHFKTAEFIINDVTNSIVSDDEAMYGNGLEEDLKQKLYELEAFLARDTIRTGLQAGSEYYIEVTRTTETTEGKKYVRKKKNDRGVKEKSKEKKKIIVDTKQLSVFVPEMSTGSPVYDSEARARFNAPHIALTNEDFQQEVIGMLEPYSDISTKTKISFHGKKWNDFDKLFNDHYYNDLGRRSYFRWQEYYKINRRFIADGDLLVQFRKHTSRPLFEEDQIAWAGALKQKFSDVKTTLDIIFARSENGYKLRSHSKSYDKFKAAYDQMVNGLQRVLELGNSTGVYFLNQAEVARLSNAYPEMNGKRPDSLESSIEIALTYANEAVRPLIAESINFSGLKDSDLDFEKSEYEALLKMDGNRILGSLSEKNSDELLASFVDLYMTGKEELVKDLFNKMSRHIMNKIKVVENKLDTAQGNVFFALEDATNYDISEQLENIKSARSLIDKGQSAAFQPDVLVTAEIRTTALETFKSAKEYKQIYRDSDVLSYVQVSLRKSLGDAKEKITLANQAYKENPSIEVKQALIEFINFYRSKLEELDKEFWPFIKYKPLVFADDCTTKTLPSGKVEPVCFQKFTIEEMPLFTGGQRDAYSISTVLKVKGVEETYATKYLEDVYLSLEKYALEIGEVYREFTEYPSHNISVFLKSSLENFAKQRRVSLSKINNYLIDSKIEDASQLEVILSKYEESIEAINWVNEVGSVGHSEADLINEVESLRARYDDLLIPIN